jgi:hypothetical protein
VEHSAERVAVDYAAGGGGGEVAGFLEGLEVGGDFGFGDGV